MSLKFTREKDEQVFKDFLGLHDFDRNRAYAITDSMNEHIASIRRFAPVGGSIRVFVNRLTNAIADHYSVEEITITDCRFFSATNRLEIEVDAVDEDDREHHQHTLTLEFTAIY